MLSLARRALSAGASVAYRQLRDNVSGVHRCFVSVSGYRQERNVGRRAKKSKPSGVIRKRSRDAQAASPNAAAVEEPIDLVSIVDVMAVMKLRPKKFWMVCGMFFSFRNTGNCHF